MLFRSDDQQRLQRAVVAAAGRGAAVLVSNSCAPEIEAAYRTAEARRVRLRVDSVKARRAINSRASARGAIRELVITNARAKLKMARVTPRETQAPAIQTSFRHVGHAKARRMSATKET